MCELLVFTRDPSADANDDRAAMRHGPGDIVTIQENGYAWGAGDTDATRFKIVQIPNIAKSELEYTLASTAQGAGQRNIRLWRLKDVLNLPTQSNMNVTAFVNAFLEAKPAHVPQGDAAVLKVIGDDPRVIG